MKMYKKVMAAALAGVMTVSMSATAFAADDDGYILKATNEDSKSSDNDLVIAIEGSVSSMDPANIPDTNAISATRGVYETPGGTILYAAHQQLEELILDRATAEVKKEMSDKLAQLVYEGKWFTPLREAIQAFVESTQKYVTGEVKFKLYKGNIIKAGTTSPYSLYNESLASFTTGDMYDHHDADGFITLFGLPLKVRAMKLAEVESQKQTND